MISASHASRRRTPGGSSVPSAVTPTPRAWRSSFRVWWSRVTRSRAGVAWVSGGRSVSRACWAVATRASQSRAPWSRGSATCVRGSPVPGSGLLAGSVSGSVAGSVVGSVVGVGRVSGMRAVLISAPSSAVPRPVIRTPPARSWVIARYRSRCAARSSRSRAASSLRSTASGSTTSTRCRPALASSVASNEAAWRIISLSPRRRVQSCGGRSATARTTTSAWAGETVPATSASPGPLEGTGQCRRPDQALFALPAAEAGDMGEPVTGRPVRQLVGGEVAGVGLDHRPGLDHRQHRGQLGDQPDGLDQLLIRPARPQRLRGLPERLQRVGQHPDRAGTGAEFGDRHTNTESGTTDNQNDIHRVYPTIRDHPQKQISRATYRPQAHGRGRHHRTSYRHPMGPRGFRDGRRATSSTSETVGRPPPPAGRRATSSTSGGGGDLLNQRAAVGDLSSSGWDHLGVGED